MKKESKAYATYWRANLADVALQGGEFEPSETIAIAPEHWSAGKLLPETVTTLFEASDARRTEAQDPVVSVEILAYAKPHYRITQHGTGRMDGIPSHLSTVMLRASVSRDGTLAATSNPYIARTLLEPLEFGKITIGSMDHFDRYTSGQGWEKPATWSEQMVRCDSLEQEICDLTYLATQHYARQNKIYLAAVDSSLTGPTAQLIKLYDAMQLDDNTDTPLFDDYATGNPNVNRTVPEAITTVARRTGYMEPAYALTTAQRDALSAVLMSGPGEIVAINGPPGTGKTTLLQSIVASLWTSAVLDGNETPPVIVTSSTNNQAITNVIDSFGRVTDKSGDALSGRWLPDLVSFGSYYPAVSKEKEAQEKGYQTEEMWKQKETTTYLEQAEKVYLDTANHVLGGVFTKIDDVTNELRTKLHDEHEILTGAINDWEKLLAAKQTVQSMLGEDPKHRLNAIADEVKLAQQKSADIRNLLSRLDEYIADEPFWLPLLSSLPFIARKRVARLRTKLQLDSAQWPQTDPDQIECVIRQKLETCDDAKIGAEYEYRVGQASMAQLQKSGEIWLARVNSVGLDGYSNMDDFDQAADTTVRQTMFKLATHYWEGRWLVDLRQLLQSGEITKRGKKHVEARWRRRAMLTPCTVCTLFLLPRLFSARRKKDNEYFDVALYNFIDLLIVDEAGQALPSIGGPAFALSGKAVVVGDTLQIAPVGNCDKASDAGNLREAGVGSSYDFVEGTGRAARSGSVMKVAQAASHFHYDKDLDRGMMLYEHRRCVDDIIQFCNDLCYKGKLIPMRGNLQEAEINLPKMGYIHVPGESAAVGKSRINRMEAEATVSFVVNHAQALKSAYPGKNLNELIAISTPFLRQAKLIGRNLGKAGLEDITVGTVHRMQGAEYRVMLFSPVYTRHSSSMYMLDEHPYILNVAVSRAQDSFIVIGDMDAFDESRNTPSGLLARQLFAAGKHSVNSSLRVAPIPERSGDQVHLLTTQELHDAFLTEALTTAQTEVVIVSPWISGPVIDFTGLAQKIADAIKRNVKVRIYTDERSNRNGEYLKQNALEAKLQLTAAGAEVTFVRRIHNKDVFLDDTTLCRGSFNWLSVSRVKGDDQQLDASIRYAGRKVKDEKACMLALLEKRRTIVG